MANQGTAAGETTNGHAGPEQGTVYQAGGGTSTSPPIDFRRSLYAEGIANPLPELAVVSQPEPITNLVPFECDDSASTRPVVEPDDIGDRRGSAVVYVGEKPTLWRKYRTPVIIALVFAVMVLIATVVGVLVRNSNKDRSVGDGNHSAFHGHYFRLHVLILVNVVVLGGDFLCIPYPCSIVPIHQGVTKAIEPGDAAAPVPTECADSSDFLTSVSFMGVQDAPGNGGWKTTYYGAKDTKDCCSHCYKNVDTGCNSWAYMPSTGFVGTSCAMITGWDSDGDKDSTCPKGHGAKVYFTRESDNATDVGAAGPCGVVAT